VSLSEKSEALKAGSLAQARRLGHRYVGTEHILLAVARGSHGPVNEILDHLDLDPQDLQDQIEASILSSGTPKREEEIPFSPRALKTFDRAIGEAESLGQPAADPEHVLLALAQDEEGVAARVLEVFGIDYASIKRWCKTAE
jgi:ATP-dependent Clp protease ATP-binding subunit ClpC